MQYIYVAIDYGSSSLKILCDTELHEAPKYFMLEPEVIETPSLAIDKYRQSHEYEFLPTTNEVFVGVGQTYYAVGKLARQQFRATSNLARLKMSYAVPRTLAAVWLAAQKCSVGEKFRLVLTCLLPAGEYEDRHYLETDLKAALECFETPTGIHQVRMARFRCVPEGAGLSMFYRKHRNLEDSSLGVIMLGHRNTSCFVVTGNVSRNFHSSDLGFSKLVLDIQAQTSGYRESDITAVVARYLLASDRDKSRLNKLLLQTTAIGRESELEKLVLAIDLSLAIYINAVIEWLTVRLVDIDRLVVGGGIAPIFADLLETHYGDRLIKESETNQFAFYLHGGLKYPKDTLIPVELQPRFADVQCVWECDILPTVRAAIEKKKQKNKSAPSGSNL
jgi:hypothetical protein